MLKNKEKMLNPITDRVWQDQIYLSPRCKDRFITPEGVSVFHSAQITLAGISELRDSYHVERSHFELHNLFFTVNGQGQLHTADGRILTIPPQSFTILPAGLPYRFELVEHQDNYWQMAWFLLENRAPWDGIAQLGQQVTHYPQAEQIWALLSLMYHDMNERPKYCRRWLNELLALLHPALTKTQSTTPGQQRVMEVFSEIEATLHHHWSVAEIAQKCFLSEAQLNRICKQLYQRSPHQQLIQFRMERAGELLLHSQWNISDIARVLGYSDPYNFSHRFRQFYGRSPRQFRNNSRA